MNKPWMTLWLAGALAVVGSGCGAPEPAAPGPPNVLLVSLDTLRADHLSSYGYHRHTTPFLDELAAGGTRFSHASVNTHGTPSSHTTMLSSLYQETHRVWADRAAGDHRAPSIPGEIALLQEIFGAAGWTTAAVTGGAWMSSSYGFSRGFDHFSDQGVDADQSVALFLDTLEPAMAEGRPVFALFHTYEVHSPYLPPEGYGSLFGTYTSDLKPTWNALQPFSHSATRELADTDLDFLVSQYDGEIRFLDDQLRVLFSRLEAIGFLDNAVVLVTADHGEEFGDHGGLLHRGTLFDELVRVPFIVWGRGVRSGVVDPTLVSTIDIAPTLLTAAGLDPPATMEGRDVLTPSPAPWAEQRVFAQYRDSLYSVRTPRFKLIRGPGGQVRLFDLRADPRERRNLASARPGLANELSAELEAWRQDRPRMPGEGSSTTDLDPATEYRLRALGYLD
jgi:arylsulfatase A-like enzyme